MGLEKGVIFKIVELVLSLVCLFLQGYGGVQGTVYFSVLSSGTFLGYVVILIGLLIGCFLSDWKAPRPLDLYFSIFGCLLFLVSGALGLVADNGTVGLVCGVLAVVEGILFLVDAVLVYKDKI